MSTLILRSSPLACIFTPGESIGSEPLTCVPSVGNSMPSVKVTDNADRTIEEIIRKDSIFFIFLSPLKTFCCIFLSTFNTFGVAI